MSTVSEILEHKGGMVLSVNINETVFDAINLMAQVNIGAVLVQNGDTISGIFTERDYLQKIALKSLASKETIVGDVMTSPVVSASPGRFYPAMHGNDDDLSLSPSTRGRGRQAPRHCLHR